MSPPGALTMRAWSQQTYGGPDAVTLGFTAVPVPGPGEIRLRVAATSINSGDVRIMRGDPLLLRLFFGLRGPRRAVRGMDVAGTVDAVGEGVTALAVGDEVMGEVAGGGLAEHVVCPAGRVIRRPAGLDAVTAATLPLAGGTAWQALERAGVESGQRVLVVGAGGGVGTFAVRLAVLRGVEVWALCGDRARGIVHELGATHVFDYRRVDPAVSPDELPADAFDAVIDIAGTAPLRALQRLVRPTGGGRRSGVVVQVSGGSHRVFGPLGRMLRGAVLSLGGRRIRPLAAVAKPDVTRTLAALAAEGTLRPVIERTWPLSAAREALAHVDALHTVGKVVVVVAD